jgi:hypothetical protein
MALQLQKKISNATPEPKSLIQKAVTANGVNVVGIAVDSTLLGNRARSFGVSIPKSIPILGGVRLSGIDIVNGGIHAKFAKKKGIVPKLLAGGLAVLFAKLGEGALITGSVLTPFGMKRGDQSIQNQASASPTATSGPTGGGLE